MIELRNYALQNKVDIVSLIEIDIHSSKSEAMRVTKFSSEDLLKVLRILGYSTVLLGSLMVSFKLSALFLTEFSLKKSNLKKNLKTYRSSVLRKEQVRILKKF